MKYYNFTDPYFAVIGASSKERALEIYQEHVCDIDEGYECEVIDKEYMIEGWERAGYELHEIQEEGLYLLDSALL